MCRGMPFLEYMHVFKFNSYYTTWRSKSGMLFGFTKGQPTDELHSYAKSSVNVLG